MYKILIVDDEKMIREGIRAVIQWEKLEIGTVLLASSGREALEIIKREKPDILLTDICMAEITGLEMIEQAMAYHSSMRMLVLTGYDSFEYARKALQLKVQDFLLKPIDEEVLEDSIRKQVEYLKEKEKERQEERKTRRAIGVREQGKLARCMKEVLHGRETIESIQYIEENYPDYKKAGLSVAVLTLPIFGETKDGAVALMSWQILGICVDLVDIKERGISLWDDDGRNMIIVLFSERCGSNGIDIITEIARIMKSEIGSQPRTAVGNEVRGFHEIKKSYQEAIYLLESETEQAEEILLPEAVISKNKIYHDVYKEMTSQMCNNISNLSYVLRVFDAFVMATHSYNLSSHYVRKCCFEIATNLYYASMDAGCKKQEQTLESLAETISGTETKEACELTRQYIEKMLNQEEELHDIVGKAKRYIGQHLAENLTVASIAESLYVSPNYFSRLFKRVTSEGCNEYIVRKRMEKACMLLETTNFNTGKIATMVGYNDCNYFSMTFKKHMGASPTHYRSGQNKERKC